MKVAILGKLPSKFKAPFDDEEFQIYGCNVHQDMEKIPRYDVWFDIHSNPSTYTNIDKSKLILRTQYPLADAINLVGGCFFNNSISYMIAYAILQGASVIHLYGVALQNGEEIRTKQLQNVRELLMFARGKGIDIWSIEPNVLSPYPLYGA